MEHEIIRIFFWIGLFLNSIIVIPQIIKILRNKNAAGFSLLAFSGFLFLQIIVVLHAYLYRDIDLLIGMSASVVTTGLLVALIYIYGTMKQRKGGSS